MIYNPNFQLQGAEGGGKRKGGGGREREGGGLRCKGRGKRVVGIGKGGRKGRREGD